MQELIKELVDKAGLSQDSAAKAVSTMMSFVKNKLPEGIPSGIVENLLSGNLDLGSLMGGLGGTDKKSGGINPLDALKGFIKK